VKGNLSRKYSILGKLDKNNIIYSSYEEKIKSNKFFDLSQYFKYSIIYILNF